MLRQTPTFSSISKLYHFEFFINMNHVWRTRLIFTRRFSIRRNPNISSFFHFSDPPFNLATLTKRILAAGLLDEKKVLDKLTQAQIIDAIKSCRKLETLNTTGNQSKGSRHSSTHVLRQELSKTQYKSPEKLLEDVLLNQKHLTKPIIHAYLATYPYPSSVDSHFLLQSQKTILNNDMIFIALRRAIFSRDFFTSYSLASLAKPSLLTPLTKHSLLSLGSMFCMSTSAVGILSYLHSIPFVATVTVITLVWILHYAWAIKVFCTRPRIRARLRAKSGMDSLRNQSRLDMWNRIAVGYEELVEFNVDNYHKTAQENALTEVSNAEEQHREWMKGLKLKRQDTEQEIIFNEYWTRAGVGFEWVEPDQDPVDTIVEKIRKGY